MHTSQKSKVADGRHVRNRYIASEKSSDFDEIWYTTADKTVPVSAVQMSYVHIMGDMTFALCDFLENSFSGHTTFVSSEIGIFLIDGQTARPIGTKLGIQIHLDPGSVLDKNPTTVT